MPGIFILITVSSEEWKFLILILPNWSILFSKVGVLREMYDCLKSWRYNSMLLSKSFFLLLTFTLGLTICLDLMLAIAWGMDQYYLFHMNSQLAMHHLLQMTSFPCGITVPPLSQVKYLMCVGVFLDSITFRLETPSWLLEPYWLHRVRALKGVQGYTGHIHVPLS